MLTSLAMMAALAAAPHSTPNPVVEQVDRVQTSKQETAHQIVPAFDGSFYVLRAQPGKLSAETDAMVDRFRPDGTKMWTREADIRQTHYGYGFQHFVDQATTDRYGNLVFWYRREKPNQVGMFRMNKDGTKAWETASATMGRPLGAWPAQDDDLHVVRMRGNMLFFVTVSGDTGEDIESSTFELPEGKSYRHAVAVRTVHGEYDVVLSWTEGASGSSSFKKGWWKYRFRSNGALRWQHLYPASKGQMPKIEAAFASKDGGLVTVHSHRHSKEITISKYSSKGARQALHKMKGDFKVDYYRVVEAEYDRDKEQLFLAWANQNKDGTMRNQDIELASVRLVPTGKTPKANQAVMGKKIKERGYRAETVFAHAIRANNHNGFEAMDVTPEGLMVLAAHGLGHGREAIQLTIARPTAHAHRTVQYGNNERHVRPVDVHVGQDGQIHVLGIEDTEPGKAVGPQADVVRLRVNDGVSRRTKRSTKPSPMNPANNRPSTKGSSTSKRSPIKGSKTSAPLR